MLSNWYFGLFRDALDGSTTCISNNIYHKPICLYYLRQGGIKFATVCPSVRPSVNKITQKLLRGFASNFHSMCISSMARFHSKMVTFCLFVCLLLREEKPILAHTFQWAAALKWVAAQANTPLPSLFSFTVTVFFSRRINFGYSQEYMVWAKFYCSLIFPQIQP